MQADYGYTVADVGGQKVLTVKQNRSVVRAARIWIFCVVALLGYMLMWALDSIHNSNQPDDQSHYRAIYFVFIVLCIVLWVYLANRKGSGEQQFSLSPTQLSLGYETYDKNDIRDLSVQSPNGMVVTGRNQFEAQANANLANLAMAPNFSVTFDYGRKRIVMSKFLTEPQAYAVAREVANWLSA